jgi:hypothetical protein
MEAIVALCSSIKARLLCVHPYENLISNIGFGVKATHTTEPYSRFSNLRSSARFDQDIDTTIDRIDKKYTRFLETEFFHDRLTLSGIYHRLIRKIAELNQRWPTEKIRKLSAKTANP